MSFLATDISSELSPTLKICDTFQASQQATGRRFGALVVLTAMELSAHNGFFSSRLFIRFDHQNSKLLGTPID